jgi:hypothetical protein
MHETNRNCGRFGSQTPASGKVAGRRLENKGRRGRHRGEPAVCEHVEVVGRNARRERQSLGRQAAARAAVPTFEGPAGQIGSPAARRTTQGGLRYRSLDHTPGEGTGRTTVRCLLPSDASWPDASRPGVFLPKTQAAEQGTRSPSGCNVARESLATDKKRAPENKLAWFLSTNRASCRSPWCDAPGPSAARRRCSINGIAAIVSASSRRWPFRQNGDARRCSFACSTTTPRPKTSSGFSMTCGWRWGASCGSCGTTLAPIAVRRTSSAKSAAAGRTSNGCRPTRPNSTRWSMFGVTVHALVRIGLPGRPAMWAVMAWAT